MKCNFCGKLHPSLDDVGYCGCYESQRGLRALTPKCRFCGRLDEGTAGDYYHKKQCEQNNILKQLENETDPAKIYKLRIELENARYVGD